MIGFEEDVRPPANHAAFQVPTVLEGGQCSFDIEKKNKKTAFRKDKIESWHKERVKARGKREERGCKKDKRQAF